MFVDVDVGIEENLWAADEVNFGPSAGISVLENVKNLYISLVGFVSEEDEGDVSDSDGIADEDEKDGSSGTEIGHDLGDEAPYSYSGQGFFDIGMTFANAKEARDAINDYGVKFGFKLKFLKNEPSRLRVICLNEVGCPFKLFVSKDRNKGGLAMKIVVMEHICFRQFKVPSASQHFLAKYFKNQIYKNPKFSVKDMQTEVEKHLKIYVSKDKCKRAKRSILHELDGSFKKEFGYLEAYVNALIRENPGTITQIQFCEEWMNQEKRIFKRMFVMFDASKFVYQD
ncbi:hypothetical protein C2S52_018276 [Perilla frutescens var. hirtella]|nr:hypothetical protein C2S52_018276 [Perilla frutescens var. hirtella]